MRPIKFRAWDKKNQRFVGGEDLANPNSIPMINCGDSFELKSKFEPMQFTGLFDKNGKEIWEGDIFSAWGFTNLVEWKHGAFGYRDHRNQFHSFVNHEHLTKPQMVETQVIGNIYETPELLEKKP